MSVAGLSSRRGCAVVFAGVGTQSGPHGPQAHHLGPGPDSRGLEQDRQPVCLWPIGGPPEGARFCGRGERCLTHSCPPAKKEQRAALRGVWPAGLHPGWVQRWAAPPHEDLQRCLGARPGLPGGRAPTGPFESVPFMNVILFIRFSGFDLCGKKADQNLPHPMCSSVPSLLSPHMPYRGHRLSGCSLGARLPPTARQPRQPSSLQRGHPARLGGPASAFCRLTPAPTVLTSVLAPFPPSPRLHPCACRLPT